MQYMLLMDVHIHVIIQLTVYCVYNNTDVAHYNFNMHIPILVIFGTDTAERICY